MKSAIENAIASLHASLPGASFQMRHGNYVGRVLATSSQELSGETLSADYPQEVRRVTGVRSDFPALTRGSTVRLGDEMRIVTSAKEDPLAASFSCGLSASMNEIVATYTRAGTAIWSAAHLLAVESEVIDAASDNFAPTTARAWFVCVSSEEWYERKTEPQIGDTIKWDGGHVRVASVTKADGLYILTCRSRR